MPAAALTIAVTTAALTALLATAPAPAASTPATGPTPPTAASATSTVAPPQRCAAQIWVTLRWPGGYQGTVTLTNAGSAPMYAWYVSWELPPGAALVQVWNGVAMVSGPTAMVHAPSWHSPLAPGETVSAGFLATGEPPAQPPRTLCG